LLTVIVILGAVWIAALGAVLALCRGASHGDEALAREAAETRRRDLSAGVIRLQRTTADGIGFIAAREQRDADEDAPRVAGGPPPQRERSRRSLLPAR
jgi:hypothetical protein